MRSMQRRFEGLRLLADDRSSTATDCNHGTWNATTHTCDCASGWTTDWSTQDILAGNIVYCDSRASTPAPGNSTAATGTSSSAPSISTTWIIAIVVAVAAVLLALGVVCFCCCRRWRRSTAAQKEQEQQQQQRKTLEDSEEQQQQLQQRQLQEMQRRLHEDEAEWNREAMLQRQMWDPQMRWQVHSDSASGELWEGGYASFAAAPADSKLSCHRAPWAFPVVSPQELEERGFALRTNSRCMSHGAAPQPHYQVLQRELSSSLYDSDSTAFTTTSDACIYTDYTDSPPQPLAYVAAVSGNSPFTTPRHVEPFDLNNRF